MPAFFLKLVYKSINDIYTSINLEIILEIVKVERNSTTYKVGYSTNETYISTSYQRHLNSIDTEKFMPSLKEIKCTFSLLHNFQG